MAASTTGSLTATGSVTLTKPASDTDTFIQVAGTYATVSFVVEGSLDGTNYSSLAAYRLDTGAVVTSTFSPSDNAELVLRVPSPGLVSVRARVTAIASGSADFTLVSQSISGGTSIQTLSGGTFGATTFSDDVTLKNGGGTSNVVWDASAVGALWANAPTRLEPDYHAKVVEFYDDFMNPASATASDVHAYTSTNDGGTGTNAFQDAAGGVYNVVTAAADNDYQAMSSVAENWLFASGKKLWFEARFKVAEATTNESAWWFGLTDTLTTGGFQANTAGPLASYDGALIWKDEATMTIDFETSNAGTQATTSAMATFVSNTWTRVGFYFDGTATTSVVTPYYEVTGVDGAPMIAGTAQNITLSGLEEMHLVFGVKAGPTAAAETLQVDYIRCVQLR